MTWAEFQKQLVLNKLSAAQFSDITGYSESVISKWQHRVNGVPKWVSTWFQLYRGGKGKIVSRS